MSLTIRSGSPGDAAGASELALRAKASVGYPREWLEQWRDALTITPEYLGRHASLVAEIDREIVGICVLESRGHEGQLEHLWVAPELHRRGIGRALATRALELAAGTGLRSVTVASDPSAKDFYVRLGARAVGQEAAPMPGAPDRVLPVLEFVFPP